MSPRCQLPQPPCVLVAACTLTLVTGAAGSPADTNSLRPRRSLSTHAEAPIEPPSPPAPLGLRTDRLSDKQQDRWQSVVGLVFAEDDLGRPLHPTLRRMWDEVATSGHEVYMELAEPTIAVRCTAGLFKIESVRPDGHIVATVRLDLKTIDRGCVGNATHRGFRRFHKLTREGRYAEVLGHELGHAVWTLADPARARDLLALQGRLLEVSRSLLNAKREQRAEIRRQLRVLGEQLEALETPAWAAEIRVWRELVASQAARGVQNASSPRPDPCRRSPRLSAEKVE